MRFQENLERDAGGRHVDAFVRHAGAHRAAMILRDFHPDRCYAASTKKCRPLAFIGKTRMELPPGFGIKEGYRVAGAPSCYLDSPDPALTYQPHVYELAGFLATRSGARHIIDIGCGNGRKLLPLAGDFRIWCIDVDENLRNVDPALRPGRVFMHDLEGGLPELPCDVVEDAVVVCSDVIEHLADPAPLLAGLAGLSRQCR